MYQMVVGRARIEKSVSFFVHLFLPGRREETAKSLLKKPASFHHIPPAKIRNGL
jgi:hypothetical protein